MRNRLFKIGIGLMTLGALAFPAAAAPVTLHGHVPAAVARLKATGPLPSAVDLNLAIGLPLRNQSALSNLLQQLYDPASPNYHHFLTPDQFTAQFGPTPDDYQKVLNFAQASGLKVTHTHTNRLLVDITGKVSDVEKAFHVGLHTYRHPTENRTFYAPDSEPSVDSSLPVLHVSGLDNYALPKPLLHKMPAGQGSPARGSGPGRSYLGSDFRNAYVPGTSLDGSGQTVGLLEFNSGYFQSDITAYENLAGLPNVLVQPVLLDGYGGGLGDHPDEVSLDIEMAIAMAPGLSKVVVYEGEITDDILSAMVANPQIKQFGASWSYSIDSISEQLFKQMAVQGQSFYNASGDFDSWAGFGFVFPPCDDPYITIVGGTTLTTTAQANWASETVWNWGTEYGIDGIGSGGGISSTYAIPSWQTNVNMTGNGGSTTFRNLPDVALTADNIYVIYSGGQAGIFGGTSCATPLWAAFTALVNQQAVSLGKSTMGFINPELYALAEGPNYNNLFHDITTGNNTWSFSPSLFVAVPGYDLCTGWGTPNGTNLINALVGIVPTHPSAPPPPFGSSLAGLNGSNPNGPWNLFIYDDGVFDIGVITNGWILDLTVANPVGASADNGIIMTANPAPPIPVSLNANAVFTIAVTNYGPSPATNVLVTDNLPGGVSFVSATNTLGSFTPAGSTISWRVGTNISGLFILNTNVGGTLTITVKAIANGSQINTALINADTPDGNPDDSFASTNILVGVAAPPTLSKLPASSTSNFVFSINSQSYQTNEIQWSTNLVNWYPIYTNVGPFNFTNLVAPGYPIRFFRDIILGP